MQSTSIDHDIGSLLTKIEHGELRKEKAYALGRTEAWQDQQRDKNQAALETMFGLSESFFEHIKAKYRDLSVKETFIGTDYASETPVALFLVSDMSPDQAEKLEDDARYFERFFWDRFKIWGNIWIIRSSCADREMIDKDFPWQRVFENAHS